MLVTPEAFKEPGPACRGWKEGLQGPFALYGPISGKAPDHVPGFRGVLGAGNLGACRASRKAGSHGSHALGSWLSCSLGTAGPLLPVITWQYSVRAHACTVSGSA